MDKEALKAAVCSAIDAAKADIEKLALCIESEPELGFKETKTAKKVEDYMRSLGLDPRTGLALTGVKARVKGGKPGPSVAIMHALSDMTSSEPCPPEVMNVSSLPVSVFCAS